MKEPSRRHHSTRHPSKPPCCLYGSRMNTRPEPALADLKVPRGGNACPSSLSPQHAMLPSVRTPQAWNRPTLTDWKEPSGGMGFPWRSPQQEIAPVYLDSAGIVMACADGSIGIRRRSSTLTVEVAAAHTRRCYPPIQPTSMLITSANRHHAVFISHICGGRPSSTTHHRSLPHKYAYYPR